MIRIVWVVLAIGLAGCVNLKEVRDYAGESAQLTSYTDATNRWETTSDRTNLVLPPKDREPPDKGRKAAATELRKIHETVSTYFDVMAKLAGDDSFAIGSNIDRLGKSIKESPLVHVDSKQVDAYADLIKVLSSIVLSGYQQHEIKSYLERGNAPIQTLLAGMNITLNDYDAALESERQSLGFLVLVNRKTPQDEIIASLASIEHARLLAEVDSAAKQIKALHAALAKIAEGHQQLYDHRDSLSAESLRATLMQLNSDLASVRKDLKTLGV